jgi:hypothetical protein
MLWNTVPQHKEVTPKTTAALQITEYEVHIGILKAGPDQIHLGFMGTRLVRSQADANWLYKDSPEARRKCFKPVGLAIMNKTFK